MSKRRKIVVIGNGPSLRGLDFHSLGNVDTMGMNAAYRYWDRVNWYPTYYCCLDDQLIITHHDEIKRLVMKGHVEKAYVHGSFFDYHPECASDHRFWSHDQFSKHWFKHRGEKNGFEFIDSPAYQSRDTTKVTTGAYAVRFCANLGYTDIGLIGIDLNYQEILPEAKKVDGIKLEITETPTHNPNYFFDDYQQKGDKYNVPNPDAHQGELHIDSFRVLRDDFFEHCPEIKLSNCNPDSALQKQSILPFVPLNKFIGQSLLGSVVVPCTPFEIDQILANFKLWSQPHYSPSIDSANAHKPALVFVFNNNSDARKTEIESAFEKFGMERFFSSLSIRDLSIAGDADLYSQDYAKNVGASGYKAGPNNLFFGAMAVTSSLGHYTFQMESDAIPIRAGWLDELNRLVNAAPPFFVMGSAYRGVEPIAAKFRRHLNGNAVYAAGDPEFQTFLEKYWKPELEARIKNNDRRLAYDCLIEELLSSETATEASDKHWRNWQETVHYFQFTNYIQNISGRRDLALMPSDFFQSFPIENPSTYIVHSQALAKSVLLAVQEDLPLIPSRIPCVSISKKLHPKRDPNAQFLSDNPPKLLIFDITHSRSKCATGALKGNVLKDYPSDRVWQVYKNHNAGNPNLGLFTGSEFSAHDIENLDNLYKEIDSFNPDIILYRPVPNSEMLHAFAMRYIKAFPNKPLVSWIMDDWPEEIADNQDKPSKVLLKDWNEILNRSTERLSISSFMSDAFETRYGYPFTPIANGVLESDWLPASNQEFKSTFRIRYAGNLAENMTSDTISRIAQAVEDIGRTGVDILFEIKTRPHWKNQTAHLFKGLKHTKFLTKDFAHDEYINWLSDAQTVVIGYNFDGASQRYTRFSLANKLPECLASGVPLLIVGPEDCTTLKVASRHDVGFRVTNNSIEAINRAISSLLQSTSLRRRLATRAQTVAFNHFSLNTSRTSFFEALRKAQLKSRTGKKTTKAALHQLPDPHRENNSNPIEKKSTPVPISVPKKPTELKQTSSARQMQYGSKWYSKPAHLIKSRFPELFSMLRFFKRSIVQLVTRPLPAAILLLTVLAAGLLFTLPALSSRLSIILPTFAITLLSLGLVYLAYRTFIHIESLHRESKSLNRTVSQRNHALETAIAGLSADVRKFSSHYSILKSNQVAFKNTQRELESGLDERSDAVFAMVEKKLDDQIGSVESNMGRQIQSLSQRLSELGDFVNVIQDAIDSIDQKNADRIAEFELQTRSQLENLSGDLMGSASTMHEDAISRIDDRTSKIQSDVVKNNDETLAHIAKIAAQLDEKTEQIAAQIKRKFETEHAKQERLLSSLNANISQLEVALDRAKNRHENATQKIESLSTQIKAINPVKSQIAKLQLETADIDKTLDEIKGSITQVSSANDETLKTVQSNVSRLRRFSAYDNSHWYQRFNRSLEHKHVQEFETKWTKKLSTPINKDILGYMAEQACEIERRLQGRLATNVEDVVLRTLVANSVKNKSIKVLEIGTLFGTGSAIMFNTLQSKYKSVHFTLLDPLDGYYHNSEPDILTGQIVDEATFHRNMKRAGLLKSQYTLIKHLSSDPEALSTAAETKYDVLVIDGDHSYAGAKTDFELYAPLVKVGGFIIFDDYSTEDWPDVQAYVDAEMPNHSYVTRVGHSWRTCVYRVVKSPPETS